MNGENEFTIKIADMFDAKSSSLHQTFTSHGGSVGFAIPIYQRNYDWGEENISRLIEDIRDGVHSIPTNTTSLTFLGAIILVDEGGRGRKGENWNGQSFSIVDGQQRLTTLALLCAALYESINIALNEADIADENTRHWIQNEVDFLSSELLGCLCGGTDRRKKHRKYNYYPRIIRVGQGNDTRGSDNTANYNSNIGFFLHEIHEYFYNSENLTSPFNFIPRKSDDNSDAFINNLKIITNKVSELVDNNCDLCLCEAKDLLHRNYTSLFKEVGTLQNKRLHEVREEVTPEIEKVIRLIVFCNYLLDRVAITRVEVSQEDYAFDIFEALNTTGEPLTPLETFKPQVIRYELSKGNIYENTKSSEHFQNIDSLLDKYRKKKRSAVEIKDTVTTFAYYLTGSKVGASPASVQRKYLRYEYESVTGHENEYRLKEMFVGCLYDVLSYRDKFWDSDNLLKQLIGHQDELLIFLQFFKSIKSTLTLPILARFYYEYKKSENAEIFKSAVQALAAFTILRRTSTGDTRGIDSDYRKVINQGGRTANTPKLALKVWNKNGQKFKEVNTVLPSKKQFHQILKSYLELPRLNLIGDSGKLSKEQWIQSFIVTPIYKWADVAKVCLLLAFHNSIPDDKTPGLLKAARNNPQELNYLSTSSWTDGRHETIEHVFPQSPRNKKDWDQILFSDQNRYLNCIGNLTLLPRKENDEVSNASWGRKRDFFRAFSARNQDELDAILDQAQFGLKIKNYLKESSSCLPVVSCIASVEEWTAEFVHRRAVNMAERIWDNLSIYLSLDKS